MTSAFRTFPWGILIPAGLLCVLGLLGLQRADELYGESRLFQKQLIWMAMALPVMVLTTCLSYRPLKQMSPWFYGLHLILLTVVLFMPAVNGSRRWIPLGIFDYQPSETARLAFIMALGWYLMYRRSQKTLVGFVPPFLMTLVPLFLIFREPDLGTAMLFLPILFAMLLMAGAKTSHLLAVIMVGICLLPVLWLQMSAEQKSRVTALFQQRDGGLAPENDGYHLHQSKQVLALGGFTGSEFQEEPVIDDLAAWALPAARTDFILCLIGERFGVPGMIFLFSLYAVIIGSGLKIAARTREPFGRLVAVGIVTMIATQALINAAMTVGLMPITGITLPLCSYGGSSLLSTALALGLLMNIGLRPGYEVVERQVWEDI